VCQVSSWKLAREVARSGELGIISGTAMDVVLLRWMQDGDPDGLYRRALAAFPDQDMVKRFMDKYYIEGGKPADKPYRGLQMWTLGASQELREACVLGNFAEVGTENARSLSLILSSALAPPTGVAGGVQRSGWELRGGAAGGFCIAVVFIEADSLLKSGEAMSAECVCSC
jgi:NAD(P)H-dependent flavin oxidoreductase YrpB (nitropropane dioxygenase family)